MFDLGFHYYGHNNGEVLLEDDKFNYLVMYDLNFC